MTHTGDAGPRARLTLGVLGPLRAELDGEEVPLGGPRQRAVVAVLVLARGDAVSSETLLDALWSGSPPPSGAASLQSYVSHLRRALEPDRTARAPGRVLASRGSGYAIPLGVAEVDAWRFEDLVDRAAPETDPTRRVQLLRDALALWRGPALGEYAGADWAEPEARRLDEIRDLAREQLLGARLDRGETALVVPEIEALLASAPLREERWRLLALAQYRSHRQADALATLRAARARLADELGVDPGPALRSLEAEVLAQSPELDAPPQRTVVSPAQAAPARPDPARPAPARPELVDRAGELAQLRRCLEEVLGGGARLAMIEGPAGIGKTSLLHQVRDEARAAGATVLSARGSQLEKEFGFGAVRQLFEPVLAGDCRESLLTGAAIGAGRVFDATAAPSDAPESLFTILHGLYWLTSNLSTRGPLVLVVDDVQWCDTASLRYLGYLAHRLEGLPVLVVATWRTGEQHADDDLLHEIALGPGSVSVRPTPLSVPGTREVVRGRLPGADEAFVGACYRTTSGNPLLLRQLLRALEAEGVRPDASHADTVRAIGSRAVSSMVLMRFRRMPSDNRTVARAIAVLGDGASLPMVSAMTGLGEAATGAAVAGLARSEVLRPDFPLGFVHPLVEAAVYDDLPLGERELQHDRAAQVLGAAGASPEQVAAHLLVVPPRGDAGVVSVLRAAAAVAVERSAGESATAYLRRAVAEPPGPAELPGILMELGRLEAMGDGPMAMEHLAQAYRLLEDPVAQADTAVMLTRTAVFAAPPGEAARLARTAADRLDPSLADQHQALVALEHISAHMHTLDLRTARLGPVPEITGTGTGARALAGAMAWYVLCRGEDRAEAMRLARFAIEGRSLARTDPGLLWVVAGMVLGLSGENTRPYWESELVEAYRTGGLFAAMSVHLWLGHLQWQFGELREAQQSMVHCIEQSELWGNDRIGQPYADAFTVQILLDMGDVRAAGEHLDRVRDFPRGGEGARFFVEAQARYALVTGDPARALELLESVQDVVAHVLNPVWHPWRSMRARVLAELGRHEEALRLVEEELELARRWGTPALLGATLRCLGELQDVDHAVPTLREAAVLLARSPRRLEEAHALTSLSLALRAGGRSADDEEVRTCLRRALELAEQCGAAGLRSQVVGLLADVGLLVPPEPDVRSTLTVAERRIAAMAADGVPPGDIAQALFVTQHRVQSTLASVVERLGVSSVTELGPALLQLDRA
ncbi:MAG TPA: BTAD domain-containing putative transcriptional regulator [Nocardioidaceae bacterium]|nr:BTAD domain-containing putative transcriptional regulator [Nocardioidaceae bacterium]